MSDVTLPAELAPVSAMSARTRLMPSFILGLSVYLLLISGASQLLSDPDTQWHIAVGRWILANGRVPWMDVFSHTFHGAPWIAKEWGSQLIMAVAYRLGGWTLVAAISAASIAIAFAMLHAWLARRLRFSAALALTLVAILLTAPHLLARPHVLVFPVTVLWTIGLVAALERGRAPPVKLAFLMVVWVNLHGSFAIGLVLAGLLAGEGVLCRPSWAQRRTALRGWAIFLALTAAATLMTPYGWNAILVPLRMAGSSETLPFIAEWQPLSFDGAGILALALFALGLVSLGLEPRRNIFRLVVLLVLGVMAVRHVRFIDQLALVAPILFAEAFAARVGLLPAPAPLVRPAVGVAAAGMMLAAFVLTVRAAPRPGDNVAPEAALHAARDLSGPVYNYYDFGGFLIAHGVPTFIDGRTDQLFLDGFLPRLKAALRAQSDDAFAALLAEHAVTWAMVRPGSEEARHLAHMSKWSKLFEDDGAAVYARRP